MHNCLLSWNKEKGNHFKCQKPAKRGDLLLEEGLVFAAPIHLEYRDPEKQRAGFITRCFNFKCFKVVRSENAIMCKECNYAAFCRFLQK